MLDIRTKYITTDDFKVYFGIDLDAELKAGANPSDAGQAFLKRIEDRLAQFIDACFYRRVDLEYPNFSDYQKEQYAKALLEQAIYVYRNGDLSVDSFLDYDKGETANENTVKAKTIARNCKRCLINCGLWCTKIRLKRGGGLHGRFF